MFNKVKNHTKKAIHNAAYHIPHDNYGYNFKTEFMTS